MEIVWDNPWQIKVKVDEKIVRIQGEALTNGFIFYKNSIQTWEPPYNNEIVDIGIMQSIVNFLSEDSGKNGYGFEFE